MAKKKSATVKPTIRKVHAWPGSADLGPWLERYLDALERRPNATLAGIKACVPLKQLAGCGEATAALKRLQRFLDRLPADECEATGYLALAGAEICLDLPDPRRAEKYLQLVESRRSAAEPRVQKAFEIRLQKLRAANGLPDPDAASLDEEDPLRRFGKARHAYRAALLAGDAGAAAKALQKAAKLIPEIDDFVMAPGLIVSMIGGMRRLDDDAAVARYVTWLDRNGHGHDLATGSLWALGLHELADKRAKSAVDARLKKLKSDPDSNIHFPVHEIVEELWFFLQTGQKETAEKLLRRTLRELPSWPGVRGGFATSGVLTELAELLAEFDGPEAALTLLGYAVQAGEAEQQPGFRKGALKAAKQQIAAPGLAAAIEQAGAIKDARKRRETRVPLLTQRGDWPALATLLDEIADVDELAGTLHSVLFKLPGGARLT